MVTNEEYKERRDRWLADLRSGKFAQARGSLHMHHTDSGVQSFCCLGVLCQTQGAKAGMVIPSCMEPYAEDSFRYAYDDSFTALSARMREYMGFKILPVGYSIRIPLESVDKFFGADHPVVQKLDRKYMETSLESLNDNGMSFTEIAAYIEANPESVWRHGSY